MKSVSKRVLITGATGFAGRYLVEHCEYAGDSVTGVGSEVNLLEAGAIARCIRETEPEVVYHLAALAHVGKSWEEPQRTLQENIQMTHNLLEAVRSEAPTATVLIVSSGEVYGPPDELPVRETASLRPQNPYALSKVSCDLLGGFYADAYGLRVIRARAFNHSGPGQQPHYVISAFARQVAMHLEQSPGDPIPVVTGNPNPRRDITDVRDVVKAYRLLTEKAQPGPYNICSGRTVSPLEILGFLEIAGGQEIQHRVDPALQRAHEVLEIRGSCKRLQKATGWGPTISFEETVRDTLSWWRKQFESSSSQDREDERDEPSVKANATEAALY